MKKMYVKTVFAYTILLIITTIIVAISIITPSDKDIWENSIRMKQQTLDSIFTVDPGFYDCVHTTYDYEKLQEAKFLFFNSTERSSIQKAYEMYTIHYNELMITYTNFKVELEY